MIRTLLLLSISIVSVASSEITDQEIDAFMIRIVEETVPQLPIIVDDQSRTTSMFYDTRVNTLIYGIEVTVEGDFSRKMLDSTREKARNHTATSACHDASVREVLNLGVQIHYRSTF